jgi:hypothetical protein
MTVQQKPNGQGTPHIRREGSDVPSNQDHNVTDQPGFAPPAPAQMYAPLETGLAVSDTASVSTPVPPGYPQPEYVTPGQAPAGYGQPGYGQPGYVTPGQLPAGYASAGIAMRPSVWPVVVLTLLFGVFGLIPAYLRANNARRLGISERPYWQAWAITFVCWIGLLLVL